MTLCLAGDIGGTKTILRLVQAAENDLQPLYTQRFRSADFPDLAPMVHQFLKAAKTELNQTIHPLTACFGIAGPVNGNTATLTNLRWMLSGDRLSQELGIDTLELINDFAAIGYGLFGLKATDLVTLQAGEPNPQAPVAYLGAGTGLGEGFAIPVDHFPSTLGQAKRHLIFPSEGSHVEFGPRTDLEVDLRRFLQAHLDISHVSVERVVSGMGIVSIFEFTVDRHIAPLSPAMQAIYQQWRQEISQGKTTLDLAAEVSQRAIAGTDKACQSTMDLFVGAYGAEAGNLILKLLPYGGLYVAGGIAAKILPLLKGDVFLQALQDKGRVSAITQKVPVYVVTNPEVGLLGAGLRAFQLLA
jgi:glucokinase